MNDDSLVNMVEPRPVTRQIVVTIEVGRLGHTPTVGDWHSYTKIRNAILRMSDDPKYSNDVARVISVLEQP